jgi:phosphate-selective porin
MDAFVAWEKYNWARIAMGSFKQPFGREVVKACWDLTTIDRAIVSDQLVSPQRDYGIMVLGGNKYNRFNYRISLMNGRGLNVKDNNNKKDIIGRVTYQLFDFLSLGANFRYGFPNNDTDTRTTYGGDFLIDLNNLHIQGEYIYDTGDYNRAAGGGCGSEPLELGERRDGAYAMIWYDTKWNIQPVFKYEFFDQDLDIKKIGYQERMTIGVNYFVGKMFRIQLNYQANIETYINIDNDKFLAQLQIRF